MTLSDHRPGTSPPEPGVTLPTEDVDRETESPGAAHAAPWPHLRLWLVIVIMGLLAGLAAFGIGEAAPGLVRPSTDLPPEIRTSSMRRTAETDRRQKVSQDRAAALAYGGLGMLLGMVMGATGGQARRSSRAAIAAGVTGLVLGGAAGAGATLALLPSYHRARAAATDEDYTKDLALAMRTHGGIWIAVGAAAGLALGIGLGGGPRMVRAVIGGILGACVAAVIYEFGGAVLFPLSQTFRPMAYDVVPRLFAHLSVALCVSAGALLVANHLTLRRTRSQ
jgi:hypothetical protein